MEKKWYQSKLVWLGVIITLQGLIPLVTELLAKGTVSPADVGVFASGVFAVILRVWFTDSAVS